MRGVKFFIIVVSLQAILFFINSEKTIQALQKSGTILVKLIPVFLAVIILTALINYFLKPNKFIKLFGKESGTTGWLYALAAGVISHGPMYAWYPMLKDLKSHGLKDGLIATFFYARAIKIPLLPMMIDYFGLIFTVVLSIYILIGSIAQGKLIDFLTGNGERKNRKP